ncbi:MAG: 2-C-methyl-D-erythritol 2,4-cyclodiphosphate synthase [Thermogutta sp.]
MSGMFRVGLGTDIHRLEAPGPLILGNVAIPAEKHAIGHSDADALIHALIDAILGASGGGDIGRLFPDTDDANRGRDSGEMLTVVWENVRAAGWEICNLDCVIHLQRPKLAPHISKMVNRLGQLLGVPAKDINIKAKTGEGVGLVGREEVVAAECVVLLTRHGDS